MNRPSSRSIQISSAQQTQGADATGLLAEWFKRANGIGILDAMLLTDQMTYLPNDLLVKVDIATMAVSLEARSPFLDHHVIEFAASLPQNLKLRGLTSKYLLKKVLRKLLPTREPQSPQDGVWSSDWSLVPWQDAAIPSRGRAF